MESGTFLSNGDSMTAARLAPCSPGGSSTEVLWGPPHHYTRLRLRNFSPKFMFGWSPRRCSRADVLVSSIHVSPRHLRGEHTPIQSCTTTLGCSLRWHHPEHHPLLTGGIVTRRSRLGVVGLMLVPASCWSRLRTLFRFVLPDQRAELDLRDFLKCSNSARRGVEDSLTHRSCFCDWYMTTRYCCSAGVLHELVHSENLGFTSIFPMRSTSCTGPIRIPPRLSAATHFSAITATAAAAAATQRAGSRLSAPLSGRNSGREALTCRSCVREYVSDAAHAGRTNPARRTCLCGATARAGIVGMCPHDRRA